MCCPCDCWILPPLEVILANRGIYGRETPIKTIFFILIVKRFNNCTYHIFNWESLLHTPNPSPTFSNCCPNFLCSEFQGITEGYCFVGFHTVSHDVLSDYVSFHSMYIEEILHKTGSFYFFIGGNSGIGTWKYTKAILIYMNFILGRT